MSFDMKIFTEPSQNLEAPFHYEVLELPPEERMARFLDNLRSPGAGCPSLIGGIVRVINVPPVISIPTQTQRTV